MGLSDRELVLLCDSACVVDARLAQDRPAAELWRGLLHGAERWISKDRRRVQPFDTADRGVRRPDRCDVPTPGNKCVIQNTSIPPDRGSICDIYIARSRYEWGNVIQSAHGTNKVADKTLSHIGYFTGKFTDNLLLPA